MKILKRFLTLVLILTATFLFNNQKSLAAETIDSGTNYVKINNTTLEFNKVIYVDGTNGDDTNGDGSKEIPYKSIIKAQEVAVDGNAIYIKAGTYEERQGSGISENKHKLTFIGEPNETIIVSDGTKHNLVTNHAAVFGTDCSVYNLIFKYTAGNRSTNYSRALVGNGSMSSQQYGKFYNCVFIATDKAPAPCYGNKDINVEFNNCSFIIPDNFLKTYIAYGKDKTKWINCAINKNTYAANTTCLGNLTFSSDDYQIISDGWRNIGTGTNPDGSTAHIGVYGGPFAWNGTSNEVPETKKLKVVLEINEELQLSIDDDLDENTKMSWTSSDDTVATVDANGNVTALAPGNIMITVISEDGAYTDYINVLVVENAKDYRLAVDLKAGKSCRLTVDDLTDTIKVTWSSMDPTVAIVNNKGKVTAISKGLTIITASDEEGNEIGQIYVRVRE